MPHPNPACAEGRLVYKSPVGMATMDIRPHSWRKPMKRRMTLSCALALSIALVSLIRSDSTVHAQSTATTDPVVGFMTLGFNQVLRITVVNINGNKSSQVRFGQQAYTQGPCSGSVCKHVVASQDMSAPILLAANEAASFDIPSAGLGVRGVVVSSSRDAKVTSMIIDSATGDVVSLFTNDTIKTANF